MMNKQTNPSNESGKICFVALGAYPLLAGKNADNIIGPDVHLVILAKELIKHDFKITFITYGEGGASVEYINRMEIDPIRERSHISLNTSASILSSSFGEVRSFYEATSNRYKDKE